MIRTLFRLARFGAGLFLVTFLAVLGWTWAWPEQSAHHLPADATILCLGAGIDAKGQLDQPALRRTETCTSLALRHPGMPVVFSGGPAEPGSPSAGGQMAAHAIGLGLDPQRILIEAKAQSTLQNALFSLRMLPDTPSLVVVTEAFHLPRSYVSAKWAGAGEVILVASPNGRRSVSMLAREALAIWFNLGRALIWHLLGAVGDLGFDRDQILH